MQERRFESRTTAHKAAVKLRAEKSDRLVLACSSCPETKPLKRKQPRVGTIARRLAERFDLPAGEVREVLAAELAAERERTTPPSGLERFRVWYTVCRYG